VRIKDWYILIREMFGYSLYGLGNEQVNPVTEPRGVWGVLPPTI